MTVDTSDKTCAQASPAASDLDMNLRHLMVFMAVAESGSIRGAAERLFRANSAVARAVSALESDLGVRLFDRSARGVLLNFCGQTVLERVRRIARELAVVLPGPDSRRSQESSGSYLVFSALPSGRRLAIISRLASGNTMATVARQLSVTQPAISVAVRELEERLGVRLFERSPKGLVATEAGETLGLQCSRALAELRHIGADLAAVSGVVRGVVRIGALPLGRARILPSSIASVVTRHPGVHVVTTEGPYDVLAGQVRSGELDFVFGALRPANEAKDLDQEALFDDQFSIIARAGHPLASRRTLTLGDLRGARWVLKRPEAPAREMLERLFAEAREPVPEPAVETDDLAILRGVILESDMLATISVKQLQSEIAAGGVVRLPIDLATTRRSIGVAWRRGALPSPGTRVLLDEIRRSVRAMTEQGELLEVGQPRDKHFSPIHNR
jgi:LysR family transcriptional regulator of gallate degradation